MMSSGAFARELGVSVSVLRLWEQRGLVSPRRTPGGWRVYSDTDVKRLQALLQKRSMERKAIAAGKE